jgi:hypothetical protein
VNAPAPAPHIAYADADAVTAEIGELMWSIGVHAECGQRHAALRDVDGLHHDLCCLRDCMNRAVALYHETRRD